MFLVAFFLVLFEAAGGQLRWTRLSTTGEPPSATSYHGLAYAENEAYVLERLYGEGTGFFFMFFKYSVRTSTWTTLRPPDLGPEVFFVSPLAVYHGDTQWGFFVYSGTRGEARLHDTTRLLFYNFDTSSWDDTTPSGDKLHWPTPRLRHTFTCVDDGLFLFGGIRESKYYDDLHVYIPSAMEWIELHPVARHGARPKSKYGHTAVADRHGLLWVYGGRGEGGTLNELHSYDRAQNVWTSIESTGMPPRSLHVAVLGSSDRMLVFGGSSGGGSLGEGEGLQSDVYDCEFDRSGNTTMTWRRISATMIGPWPRYGSNGWYDEGSMKMYIIGGAVGTAKFVNDIWTTDLTLAMAVSPSSLAAASAAAADSQGAALQQRDVPPVPDTGANVVAAGVGAVGAASPRVETLGAFAAAVAAVVLAL